MGISEVHTTAELGRSGPAPQPGVADISRAFSDMMLDFALGSVVARPGLSRKARELALVAAGTVLGCAVPQAVAHPQAAMAAGATREEVTETVLQTTSYVGPAPIQDVLMALADSRSARLVGNAHSLSVRPSVSANSRRAQCAMHRAERIQNIPCRRLFKDKYIE